MTEKERQRPWRARASNPKSRNGCLSCKKRKVKCDETKPKCQRCLEFGVVCDGYITRKIASKGFSRALVPISGNQATVLRPDPTTVNFENEQEHRYFRSFCDQAAPKVKGAFTASSVWSSIVLQASYSEPGIRQAIAATGALLRKLDIAKSASPEELDKHYSSALQCYQQALRAMREIKNVRTALVACLIVFNFETLTRRADLAFKTAQSGVGLLNELAKSSQGSKDPATSVPGIEDDLANIFVSLDVLFLPVTGMPRLHIRRPRQKPSPGSTRHSLPPIPAKFSTIKEARVCLGGLLSGHGRELMRHQDWTAFVPTLQTSTASGFMIVDFRPKRWMPTSGATKENAAAIKCVVKDHSCWYQAFEHLPSTISDSNSEDFIIAILLQLHSKITCLLLVTISSANESAFDNYTTLFNDILRLCDIYFGLPDATKPSVSLGYGVLFPLLIVATRCRDWSIRRRALALLEIDHMELWDSKLLTQVATWHMKAEEAGRKFGEYIPEESRLRMAKLTLDYQRKRAWWSGFRLDVAPEDEANHLVTELVWK